MEVLSKNKIKWIRSLRLKKNRDAEKLFVVEGTKMVQEIIDQWPDAIECVVTSLDDFNYSGRIYSCSDSEMKSLTLLKTASPLLAVVKQPNPEPGNSGMILALDGIQDPGNMGTIIRTADWFGISEIVCSIETVDIFNPKVIQSSMGSLFRVRCSYMNLEEFLENAELPVFGALMEGKNLTEFPPVEKGILVMGNEGNGVSPEIVAKITDAVHIPGKGGAESLNVSVATGIILAHLTNNGTKGS